MKKLALSPALALALLFGLFLAPGCRKDRFVQPTPPADHSASQFIKQEMLEQFMARHEAFQGIGLDWNKARQATIDGRKVVRIPVLNVDRTGVFRKGGLALKLLAVVNPNDPQPGSGGDGTGGGNQGQNAHYYAQHPPEVFFIQDQASGLHSFLYNFIPDNVGAGFGQNGLWSGRLFEWNLQGDTIMVKKFSQNVITDQGCYKKPTSNGTPDNYVENVPANGQGARLATFWSRLVARLADFIGWAGSLFGLSTYYNNVTDGDYQYSAWRLNGISLRCLFGCGGSGDSGEEPTAVSYYSSGSPIYSSYLNGWSDTTNGGGGNYTYTNYPNSNGSGSGGGPNNNGHNVNQNSPGYWLVNQLDLPYEQYTFIQQDENSVLATRLKGYLELNGLTTENLEYVAWAIGYIMEYNDVDFLDLASLNSVSNTSANLPLLDVSELGNYPGFKSLVENLPQFLNDNQTILTALSKTTGFSEKKIMQLMQPGRGPKVRVIENLKDSQGNPCLGHFDATLNPNILEIDAAFVNGLAVVNNSFRKKAIGFILVITTLHEFVHYGRNLVGLDRFVNDPTTLVREAGTYWEDKILPPGASRLEPATAKEWLGYYKLTVIK